MSIAAVRIFDESDAQVMRVEVERLVSVVKVGIQGPPGASGAGFVFSQPTPATEWVINHNLGFRPAVEIIDAGGNEVDAEVQHISVNQARVYFNAAIAGEARCV